MGEASLLPTLFDYFVLFWGVSLLSFLFFFWVFWFFCVFLTWKFQSHFFLGVVNLCSHVPAFFVQQLDISYLTDHLTSTLCYLFPNVRKTSSWFCSRLLFKTCLYYRSSVLSELEVWLCTATCQRFPSHTEFIHVLNLLGRARGSKGPSGIPCDGPRWGCNCGSLVFCLCCNVLVGNRRAGRWYSAGKTNLSNATSVEHVYFFILTRERILERF